MNIALHHGWMHDAADMEPLAAALRRNGHFVLNLERGYFKAPVANIGALPDGAWIAVGHSLGYRLVVDFLRAHNITPAHGIAIASFQRFPAARSGIEELRNILRTAPATAYTQFRKLCGDAGDETARTISAAGKLALLEDLHLLEELTAENIPANPLTEISRHALHGAFDRIVPVEHAIAETFAGDTPLYIDRHAEHALSPGFAAFCARHINDLLQAGGPNCAAADRLDRSCAQTMTGVDCNASQNSDQKKSVSPDGFANDENPNTARTCEKPVDLANNAPENDRTKNTRRVERANYKNPNARTNNAGEVGLEFTKREYRSGNERTAPRVAHAFSQAAHTYDAAAHVQTHAATELIRQFRNFHAARDGAEITSIADLGAGTGTLTDILGSAYPHAHITAFDFAPGMIEAFTARVAHDARMTAQLADAELLTLSEPVDLLASNFCFQWFGNFSMSLRRHVKQSRYTAIALPIEGTFSAWRAAVAAAGAVDRIQSMPSAYAVATALRRLQCKRAELQIYDVGVRFENAHAFLRMLRAVGAHTPAPRVTGTDTDDAFGLRRALRKANVPFFETYRIANILVENSWH